MILLKRLKYKPLVLRLMPVLLILVMTIHYSCTDETVFYAGIEEGRDATITLRWVADETPHMSRAALDENFAGTVNALWVGVYDYTTGKVLFNKIYEDVDGVYNEPTARKIEIALSSGRRRIVAVANPGTNFGISDNDALNTALGKTGTPSLSKLSDLLLHADTWEKYKSISASLTRSANITPIGSDIVMSGVYYDSEGHPADSWVDANDSYVDINPGYNSLKGKIHLRRLFSYVRFNIIAGKDVEIEPQEWQVTNVPSLSYLHEQQANSADNCEYFATPESPAPAHNYGTSNASYSFEKGSLKYADGSPIDKSGYWFDFYQFENKRTGISGNRYTDREKEFKDATGLNTGIFKSLCPSTNETGNNYGSYVTFRLRLSYSFTSDGKTTDRIAYARYTVHLGYCEGAGEEEKSRDFNCRRNTRYTYNITVNGADNIVVEATKDNEVQPGAEGNVYDTTQNMITLDSHYCVYNVSFSNVERKTLKYSILTYFDGQDYSFTQDDVETFGTNELFRHQLIDWIEIMPADNANTVATYPGRGKAWSLEDFRKVDSNNKLVNRHTNDKNGNADNTTARWYTIFFNEYAYSYDTDNKVMTNSHTGGEGGWEKWVNQKDRQLTLAVENYAVSPDKESTHSRSKYVFLQPSIQTYYSTTNLTSTHTAIGMEHVNECFGHNFRWTWTPGVTLNQDNGRWNVWQYVNGNKWNEVTSNQFMSNPKITEQFEYSSPTYYPEMVHPVRSLYEQSLSSNLSTDPQPNKKSYHEMISACMNRNRDLDGDGKISADELRWYVPTTGKYLRLILGRNSMREPLMDYTNSTSRLKYGTVWDANAKNSRFHFFTSDQYVLWAEEGLSKGNLATGVTPEGQLRYTPWQVRCIRNLGVNHANMLTTDPVTRAYVTEYETDADGNRRPKYIDMTYYDEASKRAPIAGKILSHKVNESANMVAPKMEIAERYIDVTLATPASGKTYADVWVDRLANDSPCDSYSESDGDEGWRVPNQKELAIMRQSGLLPKGKYLTCSRTYFDDRFVGVDGTQSQAISNNRDGMNSFRIWCVRDVIGSRSTNKSRAHNTTPAPDFSFVTSKGKQTTLYSVAKVPVLLLFYDPDCSHCRDAVATLRNDRQLSDMIDRGKVKVIAVDAEEDFNYWKRTARHLPDEWTVGFDRSGIIDNDLYDIDALPAIYLLDADRSLKASKVMPAEAVKILSRIINKKK